MQNREGNVGQVRRVYFDVTDSRRATQFEVPLDFIPRPGSSESARGAEGTFDVAPGSAPSTPHRLPMRSRGNSLSGKRPQMSRNESTNTITQSRSGGPASPGLLAPRSSRGQLGTSPRQRPFQTREVVSRASNPANDSSSSSDESSSDDANSRSQLGKSHILRRGPRFATAREGKQKVSPAAGDATQDDQIEDDDDDGPAFFTVGEAQSSTQQDLGATLKNPQQIPSAARPPVSVTKITSASNTDSSAS